MAVNEKTFDNPSFTPGEAIKDESIVKTDATCSNSKSEVVGASILSGGPENGPSNRRVLYRTLKIVRGQSNLFLATISALLYSVKSLITVYLVEDMNPFQSVVMFMPVMLTGSCFSLAYKKIPPPKNIPLYVWLLLGSLSFSSYLLLFSLSVLHMDVADATTILYASLMFTGILSWIVLREPLRIIDFVNVSIAFAGIIFISRPPFIFGTSHQDVSKGKNTLLGTCFALGSSFSVASGYTAVRKQSSLGIHVFVSMLCTAIVASLSNAAICTAVGGWKMPQLKEWAFAIGGGLSYFGAQTLLFVSLSRETATYVNIVMTSEIVFTFLLQFFVLHVAPPWTSYIGAVLVAIACVGVALSKKRDQSVVE